MVGYRVARKLFVGDQFICWGGYYPDYQLRLFRNAVGGFNELAVHESVQLPAKSKIRNLKNPLDHFSYDSLEQMDREELILTLLNFVTASAAADLAKASETVREFHVDLCRFCHIDNIVII